jgi:hypothetical protein
MANTYTTSNLPNSTFTVTNGGSSYTGSGITLNTGAGVSGSYLTAGSVTGSATYSTAWTPPSQNFVSNQGKPIMTIPAEGQTVVLDKAATLEVQGNVVINGLDLEERLKTIERLLLIPERDVTMEAKYPSLKKKYDEYINTLEKYRTFERIKGDDDGTT